jgi:mRNA interferase RelE/StbE
MSAIVYDVVLPFGVEKKIRKFPKKIIERVRDALDRLKTDPIPFNCKPLQGFDSRYRIRISEYRIVYEVDDGRIVILVINIDHRKKVYKTS